MYVRAGVFDKACEAVLDEVEASFTDLRLRRETWPLLKEKLWRILERFEGEVRVDAFEEVLRMTGTFEPSFRQDGIFLRRDVLTDAFVERLESARRAARGFTPAELVIKHEPHVCKCGECTWGGRGCDCRCHG